MNQYNALNVKLSNLQHKLKSGIKNRTEVTLNLSSNAIGEFSDKTNFPQNLLSTDRQVSRLRIAFVNNLSANMKLSKAHLSKMVELGQSLLPFIMNPKEIDKI